MSAAVPYKIAQSVLVVIYTAQRDVLLLRRTQGDGFGGEFWQSVTGSKDFEDEPWEAVAAREVLEETGIDAYAPDCLLQDWALENIYPIYPQWLHRYAPGTCMNTERVFGLQVPSYVHVTLHPREHTAFAWHAWQDAAQRCYAPSNAEAILHLPAFQTA
jgi:dihydroneopterin triphosphate diphosphatase